MGICLGNPARKDPCSASGQVFGIFCKPHPAGSMFDPSVSISLKSFTLNDLKSATRNFSSDNLIGEGGFGCVYKGWINKQTMTPCKAGAGLAVAVKKLKSLSFQGHREWFTEVEYLGRLRHENLVELIGYCSESKNRLLVYEFLPKGSLENHLFKKGVNPMAWGARMQIAVDIARGLAFLHSLDANIIYCNFSTSNVLIDSKFRAKLVDYGREGKGPCGDGAHVPIREEGSTGVPFAIRSGLAYLGYDAPEYVATGDHLTSKSNVYSFGVVLLELLSGRRALSDGGSSEGYLVQWAKPFLGDPMQFSRIMDVRLRSEYSRKAAHGASSLAAWCLNWDYKNRPPMVKVLSELERLQALHNY